MANVKIGHASIDENSKAKGGKAGDQTGKEVCTRTWYDKSWDVLLRPKTAALAENSARICEQICNENYVGYDQNQRNTLWTNYLRTKQVIPKNMVETDCSAFMTYCAILGGANIEYGTNAPTTSTMRSKFKASGNYEVITDKKYLTSDEYLKRGDILVSEGHHTVMVLSNGSKPTTTTTPAPAPSTTVPNNPKEGDMTVVNGVTLTYKPSIVGNYKTISSYNMRTNPSKSAATAKALAKGEIVACYGWYKGDWAFVKVRDTVGYIDGNYLVKA